MADLADLYGIPEDAPPLKRAAAKRSADAAASMRARSHAMEGQSQGRADSLAGQGNVLANAMEHQAGVDAQEAEIAARHASQQQQGMAPGPGDELSGLAESSRQRSYGLAGAMDSGYRTQRSSNAMHAPTEQYIEESRSLNTERDEIARRKFQTQAEVARDASVLADEAHQAQARMAAREQFMAEQQARKRQDIDDNLAQYNAAATKAAREFAQAEEFDPGKAWADRSAGQKFRITLAALGRGLRGGNPSEIFSEVLQRELEAHKQMRSDKKDAYGVAKSNVGEALTMRDNFLAMTGDERVADKLVEQATLQSFDAKMAAMEAKYGPAIINDQWQEARNAIEQMQQDTALQLAQAEANNPKYTYRRVDTLGKETRALMREDAKQGLKTAGEAAKQYAGMQRDSAKASVEGQSRLQMQDRKERFDQKKWLAKETEDIRAEMALIDEFERKYGDDIPGVHALSRITPDAITGQFQGNREARKEMERIVELRLRRESGAAISDEEIARATELTLGAMTEDDVRGDFDRRKREAAQRLDYLTRATSEDLEAEYLNRPVSPRSALTRGGGGGGPASLVLDE